MTMSKEQLDLCSSSDRYRILLSGEIDAIAQLRDCDLRRVVTAVTQFKIYADLSLILKVLFFKDITICD